MKIKTIKFKLKKLVLVVERNERTCRGRKWTRQMNDKGSGHSMGRFDCLMEPKEEENLWLGKSLVLITFWSRNMKPLFAAFERVLSFPFQIIWCSFPAITPLFLMSKYGKEFPVLMAIILKSTHLGYHISIILPASHSNILPIKLKCSMRFELGLLGLAYKQWQCVPERLKSTPAFYYSNYEQWDKILMTKFPTKGDILMFPF